MVATWPVGGGVVTPFCGRDLVCPVWAETVSRPCLEVTTWPCWKWCRDTILGVATWYGLPGVVTQP